MLQSRGSGVCPDCQFHGHVIQLARGRYDKKPLLPGHHPPPFRNIVPHPGVPEGGGSRSGRVRGRRDVCVRVSGSAKNGLSRLCVATTGGQRATAGANDRPGQCRLAGPVEGGKISERPVRHVASRHEGERGARVGPCRRSRLSQAPSARCLPTLLTRSVRVSEGGPRSCGGAERLHRDVQEHTHSKLAAGHTTRTILPAGVAAESNAWPLKPRLGLVGLVRLRFCGSLSCSRPRSRGHVAYLLRNGALARAQGYFRICQRIPIRGPRVSLPDPILPDVPPAVAQRAARRTCTRAGGGRVPMRHHPKASGCRTVPHPARRHIPSDSALPAQIHQVQP